MMSMLPLAVPAQEAEIDPAPDDGMSQMQRGLGLFFQGLKSEIDPAIEGLRDKAQAITPELRDWARKAGPALQDLMDEIGDLSAYEAPEKLPNGDIILRRKPENPVPLPEPEEGQIDL